MATEALLNGVGYVADSSGENAASKFGEYVDENGFAGDRLQPIAIIGMSMKFPESATTLGSFWEMLLRGKSAMTEFPKDRLNIDAFYHPDSNRYGTVSTRPDLLFPSFLTKPKAPSSRRPFSQTRSRCLRCSFLLNHSCRSCLLGPSTTTVTRDIVSCFREW